VDIGGHPPVFQLDYFGSFHVSTYFCTSRVILGP
jgi:hypothetical protein